MRPKAVSCCNSNISKTLIFCTTPIGTMMIEGCADGLHSVGQTHDCSNDRYLEPNPDVQVQIKSISGPKDCRPAQMCFNYLKQYFKNPNEMDNTPLPTLCLPPFHEAPFRQRVWIILSNNIGPGKVISYQDLAAMANSPKAALAVGSSMRCNPFQIIVPCHRVIRSNSTLGNYAGGTMNHVKEWLLAHEGVTLQSS